MTLFKHQTQAKDNCGPTCVAILAGITQNQACLAMFFQRREKYCLSWYEDIFRGLEQLKIEHGKKKRLVSKWKDISTTAIVSVSDDEHWVFYSHKEGLVYDPSRKAPVEVTKYKRKPCYYLAVKPPR
jgi:hypothetical protein